MPADAKQHVDKLQHILEDDALDIESRLFILNEIWDIRLEARK